MKVGLVVAGLVALGVGGGAKAEIRLPGLISDHAVLQREAPIRIWGWATPGAKLTVTLHGQTVAAAADRLGEWTAWLVPEHAGGPYTLTVKGDGSEGSRTVSDLLIGDVWVASGQSNIEMPLKGFGPETPVKNSAAEIAAANHPEMRLLLVEHRASDYPMNDVTASWTQCTPETAAGFSAVAYFFGREIAAKEKVPVGLIDASWGGTPADPWVSMDTLASDPALLPAFASRALFADRLAQAEETRAADAREDAEAKAAGKAPAGHPWIPESGSWMPAALYNGMIAPLTPFGIKGVIWYQGETNSKPDRAAYYAALFKALIGDWRTRFGQGDFPFLFAQISSFDSPAEDWARIRDAQRRALALRDTAMAVTLDVGEAKNVHPADKQTVGARLALAARGMVYGEKVEYQGPVFRRVSGETGGLRLWFDHAAGLKGATGGFEVAGEDGKFVAAEARIDGETVVVKGDGLVKPVAVRYGWRNVVSGVIVNAAGLPMGTFTSEAVLR